MTSVAKIKANRRNAKRSTGPRTTKGKATSANNALRHGLTARTLVIHDEDPQAWTECREALRAQFDPVGPVEELLVDRIAGCGWRLLRAGRVEASVFRHQVHDQEARRLRDQARDLEIQDGFDHLSKETLRTIASVISDQQQHEGLLCQAAAADAARDQETLATTFISDATSANALSKLSRYEVTLEGSFYKALHELQRLQAARAGQPAPLALAVDVDVSSPAG